MHYRRVDSTNERAKELGARGAPHGTVVTAAEQTAGRGRQGRVWVAPPGRALLASAIVRGIRPDDSLLPLAAAVAVCEACEAAGDVRCAIKWPNDVWIGRRKLAGILVEGRPQEGWAVIGVGINVTTTVDELPPRLHDTATSLRDGGGEPPAVEQVLTALCGALTERLSDEPAATLAACRGRDALLGETVTWSDGEGTAAGIDDRGALLVDTGGERVALHAGEVHLSAVGRAAG